jgi:diadenosine tetraphosphate (Ap4A) HIT family hydrolase
LAFALEDKFPVTKNHTLIIPKRHVQSYFDLDEPELLALNKLLFKAREMLLKQDSSITGFNIRINDGETAGQTIFHCHIHLIPRRKGDVESPRGGVRHLIAGRGFY